MEHKLDVNYLKERMSESDFFAHIVTGAGKALVSTALIVLAVICVYTVHISYAEFEKEIYKCIFLSVLLALYLSIRFVFWGTIHSLWDLVYNKEVDKGYEGAMFAIAVISAIIGALLGAFLIYISGYPEMLIPCILCWGFSLFFFAYIRRNKLTSLKEVEITFLYSVSTGVSAYLLGVGITICIGLIGFWLTMGIIALEVAFTAAYTYLDLMEWVEEQKRQQKVIEGAQATAGV